MRPHRLLTLALASALAVAACGGGADDAASPAGGPSRQVTVADVAGDVEVPVTDEGVWALDEYAGQVLLALGVTPVGVADMYQDPFSLAVLDDAGITPVPPDTVELVAGARPRLIVGTATPSNLDHRSQFEAVAPVLLLDVAAPWQDQMAAIAAAVGRTEEADALVARVDARLDALADRIAGSPHAGAVVSLVAKCGAGTACTFDASTVAGSVLDRLGFARPGSQVNADATDAGFARISEELLGEQGGDVVISLVGSVSGGESLLTSQFLPTDGAVTADVDGGAWYSMSPLNAWIVLHDLEAILFGEGQVTTVDDVPRRWDELHAS